MSIPRFYNRQRECSVLQAALTSPRSELIILYGRRGVGKSVLLEHVYLADVDPGSLTVLQHWWDANKRRPNLEYDAQYIPEPHGGSVRGMPRSRRPRTASFTMH